jgi:hypothetical protein|eukprot:scaffold247_cov174-Chaetoceros_neogracile.AAC.6
MNDVVQFKHASNAATEDAILGGEAAEKRFKFISMCVGGSLPLHSLQPSGKHHCSTPSGKTQSLFMESRSGRNRIDGEIIWICIIS